MRFGADDDCLADNRGASHAAGVEDVLGQLLELAAGFDHGGRAVVGEKVQTARGEDRRRGKTTAQPFPSDGLGAHAKHLRLAVAMNNKRRAIGLAEFDAEVAEIGRVH